MTSRIPSTHRWPLLALGLLCCLLPTCSQQYRSGKGPADLLSPRILEESQNPVPIPAIKPEITPQPVQSELPVGSPGGYALLIGINRYPAFRRRVLFGCENDVDLMASLLCLRLGFPSEHVKRLTGTAATREAILHELDRLKRVVHAGDRVVVFFSGHGAQVIDDNGDEDDRMDEVICPYDFRFVAPGRAEQAISDDELGAFCEALSRARVTVVLDCCHSGTGLRSVLPQSGGKYLVYSDTSRGRAAFFADLLGTGTAPRRTGERGVALIAPPVSESRVTMDTPPSAVLFAACQAHEIAEEVPPTVTGSGFHGALTWRVTEALLGAADDDQDGVFTPGELGWYLDRPIATGTRIQHPHVELPEQNRDTPWLEVVSTGGLPDLPDSIQPFEDPVRLLRVGVVAARTLGKDFEDIQTPEEDGFIARVKAFVAGQRDMLMEASVDSACDAVLICDYDSVNHTYRLALLDGQLRTRAIVVQPEMISPAVLRPELEALFTATFLERLRQSPRSDYRVTLRVGDGVRRTFARGEKLQFACRSNRAGYLTLINIDSEGKIHLLYPNNYCSPDEQLHPWIEADTWVYVPDVQEEPYELPVEAPLGPEVVKALVTEEKPDLRALQFEGPGQFKQAQVRGAGATRGLTGVLCDSVSRGVSSLESSGPCEQPLSVLARASNWGEASVAIWTHE